MQILIKGFFWINLILWSWIAVIPSTPTPNRVLAWVVVGLWAVLIAVDTTDREDVAR
jgi:hypothetical protein